MDEELKKGLREYYEKIERRKKQLLKISNNLEVKNIHRDSLEDDMNYIAWKLLEEDGFNFKKDRVASKRVRVIGGVLKTCEFHCSTFNRVHFFYEYMRDNGLLNRLPATFRCAVDDIKEIREDYKNEVEKFNDEKKTKVVRTKIKYDELNDYQENGVSEEEITEIKIDCLFYPGKEIECDEYFEQLLEHAEEIKGDFAGIHRKYATAQSKIKDIIKRFEDILIVRDI